MTPWLRSRFKRVRRFIRTLLPRRVWGTLTFAAALLGVGTVGYRTIEGPHWSYFDGFYMTAITLTTIGYGETHELSARGRLFTVILAYTGIFILAYFASELVRSVVTGELQDFIGRQRVADALDELKDHVIVCGYGRMGKTVCSELNQKKCHFVIIDNNAPLLADCPYEYGLPLNGDATADDTLRRAGVDRAKALITVVASDAENLFITLSARLLNSKLSIIARAEEEGAEVKLRKVGANKIISPVTAGGHRAVQAVLQPTVLHFMEMATRPDFLDLQIEEVRVEPGSWLAGLTFQQARLNEETGVVVLGILGTNNNLLTNPPAETLVDPYAILIVIGQRAQLEKLDSLVRTRAEQRSAAE
jgi:voltage-gated potassium channel